MPSHHLLQNIDTHRVPEQVLMSPKLGAYLLTQATEVATIYKGIVAKKTGRLAASATPSVQIGGHKHDRLVGKVTAGLGAEYGVLHEFGAPSNPLRRGRHELAEALTIWKGGKAK